MQTPAHTDIYVCTWMHYISVMTRLNATNITTSPSLRASRFNTPFTKQQESITPISTEHLEYLVFPDLSLTYNNNYQLERTEFFDWWLWCTGSTFKYAVPIFQCTVHETVDVVLELNN